MYRFRVIAINDAGPSEPGDPSEPVVIDVPGVQIAPYFVQLLNDTIALEHEKVRLVFLFISPIVWFLILVAINSDIHCFSAKA